MGKCDKKKCKKNKCKTIKYHHSDSKSHRINVRPELHEPKIKIRNEETLKPKIHVKHEHHVRQHIDVDNKIKVKPEIKYEGQCHIKKPKVKIHTKVCWESPKKKYC